MASAPETGVSGFRMTPFENGGAPASNFGTAVPVLFQGTLTAGNAVLFSLVITICFMGSIVTNRFWLKPAFAFGTVGYVTSLNGPVTQQPQRQRVETITLSYLESENWKRLLLTGRAFVSDVSLMNPRRRMLGPWRRRPGRTTPATSRSLNWDEPDFGRGWALYITLAIQLHAILQLRLLARRLDIAAPQRHRVYERGKGALETAKQCINSGISSTSAPASLHLSLFEEFGTLAADIYLYPTAALDFNFGLWGG
ncbi:hypothetical protein CDEST_11484 [Colletotrichum destructivum]|uniref:Uncharacterized protein n=1 Tax=Colletotrichum destructivum TaxID=34406 RepID=A0AAX4IT76_9PEZI|nr:hypothetical protein CDEST_11484 [Colletotrichum destructivum]